MRFFDYLIIGGGVAGTVAAEEIRGADSEGSVGILAEEEKRLYSRVLLPFYLRGERSFEQLYLRKEEWYAEQRIELLPRRAEMLDRAKKEVILSTGERIGYRKLLLASGGRANRLVVPGGNLPGVTYLRTIEDVQVIRARMEKSSRGVVLGGGFIGIEYLQSFVKAGIATTCVLRDSRFWQRAGEQIHSLVVTTLKRHGVDVLVEDEAVAFLGEEEVESVRLKSGKELPADIVGIGVGMTSDLSYLPEHSASGYQHIIVNEYLETEAENTWAAGDVTEFYDVISERSHRLGNWSNAQAQGRAAGKNMVAGWRGETRQPFSMVSAYSITIFDRNLLFLGDLSEDQTSEVVERGSIEAGKAARLFFRNGIIRGAILFHLAEERMAWTRLIEQRQKVDEPSRLQDLQVAPLSVT